MTGGTPGPRPSRAASTPPKIVVSPDPVRPRRSPALALGHLVVGLLILGYGMIARAPMSPSAVMSGVIDSVETLPSSATDLFGRQHPTRAVAVYLPKAPSARTFKLPLGAAALADSLHAADTLQALLGWRSEGDTATALRIMRNGGLLLDSTVVLGAQRKERSRIVLFGGLFATIGVVMLMRRGAPAVA